MKRTLSLLVCLSIVFAAGAQTADEIVGKYIAAIGGKEKLQGIRSLQYVQTMNLTTPLGPMQVTMTHIKVRDKLLRINTSSELFGNSYTVITDTSGWVRIAPNQFTGGEAVLEKFKPEDRKALAAQMDCDGYFPDLVNYAAKGYTAEYGGEGKANGRPSYKLTLKKDKAEILYFIDKATGLVNAVTYKGQGIAAAMGMGNFGGGDGDGKGRKTEITMNVSDYKEVGGVKFPGKLTVETAVGTMSATVGFVTLNQPVDPKWFRAE